MSLLDLHIVINKTCLGTPLTKYTLIGYPYCSRLCTILGKHLRSPLFLFLFIFSFSPFTQQSYILVHINKCLLLKKKFNMFLMALNFIHVGEENKSSMQGLLDHDCFLVELLLLLDHNCFLVELLLACFSSLYLHNPLVYEHMNQYPSLEKTPSIGNGPQ